MKRKKFKRYRLEFWTAADGRVALMAVRHSVLSARILEGVRQGWNVDPQPWRALTVEVKVPITVTLDELQNRNYGMQLTGVIELDPLETLAEALK